MPATHLNRKKYTDGFALYRVPEGDGSVSSSSHDFCSFGRPSDGSYLLLADQSGVQFRQLFPPRLIQIEDVDFSVVKTASEQIVAACIQMQAANGTSLIVAQSCQQFGLLSLGETRCTWEMS